MTPNIHNNQPDGTYTLSLSVKGDAVETQQITKANVLIMMDRSTSMIKGNADEGTAVPLEGDPVSGVTYYGYVKEDKKFYPLNYSNGVWTLTRPGYDPYTYTDTVYESANRLQAEQAALDELIKALVGKNDPNVPGREDIIEVLVSSFASERGSMLQGAVTQNAPPNTPWGGTTETGWLTSYENTDTLYTAVHNTSVNNGTNWQDALIYAKELADAKKLAQPNEDVYIIFLTDGEPTAVYGETSRDHGGWGAIHYEKDGNVYGGGSIYALGYAKHDEGHDWDVQDIVDSEHKFFAIFTFNDSEIYSQYLQHLVNYAYGVDELDDAPEDTEDTPTSEAFYTDARDIAELRESFDNIFTHVFDTLSYGDVKVVDGLTTKSMSTVLESGQTDGIIYTVKDGDEELVYTVTASGPIENPTDVVFKVGNNEYKLSDTNSKVKPVTVTRTRTEIIDGEPQEVSYTGTYYSLSVGGLEYRMALADFVSTGTGADEKKTLTWDLSPIGSLEKDYTYTAEFIVWPSQEAYNYVAGLNNHLDNFPWYDNPVYDEETGDLVHAGQTAVYDEETGDLLYYMGGVDEYPYIVKYPNGVYSVLTNTDQKVYYSEVHAEGSNDVITSVTTVPHEEPLETPDPMPLLDTETELEKSWRVDRNPAIFAQFLYDSEGNSKQFAIDYGIYCDGDDEDHLYTSMILGWDGEKYVWDPDSVRYVRYNGHRVPVGMRWSKDFFIASGLMLSKAEMDRLRLDTSENSPYTHYDYVTEDGTTTYYLLEPGHDYTIKEIVPEDAESWVTYEFDFVAPVYHPMLVDGKLKSVVFNKDGGEITGIKDISKDDWTVSLKMENVLRGYINLEKRVVNNDGVTAKPDDDTKFTYRIELHNDTEPGPFVGDSVPWYGVNGLFYHEHDEETDTYTYYQAEVTNSEDNKSHTLTLLTEDGEVYDAWCTDQYGNEQFEGEDGLEDYIFDEDVPGPSWVTYNDGTQDITIKLFGNEMECVKETVEVENEDGDIVIETVDSDNDIFAELQITQSQVLNLANIPKGTTYKISEVPETGYGLVNIRKEIRNGDTIESRKTYPAGDGEIEGTIVEDRDNHFIFTNKIFSKDITVKKIGPDEKPLTGAVFTIQRTGGSGESVYDGEGVSKPADGEADLGSYKFSDLPDGTYTLTETASPAGYTGISSSVTFTVSSGVVTPVSLPEGVNWNGEAAEFTVENAESDEDSITVRKQWLDADGNPDEPGAKEVNVTMERYVDTLLGRKLRVIVNAACSRGTIQLVKEITIQSTSYQIYWPDEGQFNWSAPRLNNNRRSCNDNRVDVSDATNSHGSAGDGMARWNITNLNNATQDPIIVSFTYVQSNNSWDQFLSAEDFYNTLSGANITFTKTGRDISVQHGNPEKDMGFSEPITLSSENNWAVTKTIGGTENDHSDYDLPATDDDENVYHYYIVEAQQDGCQAPSYSENNNNGITTGVLTAYNKKTERGSLSIKKLLQASNSALAGGKIYRANGKYNFTVSKVTSEQPFETEIVKYVQIRINNGAAYYKAAFTEEELDDFTGFKWVYAEGAIIDDLVPGTYVVEETGYELDNPNGYSTELVQLTAGDNEPSDVNLSGKKITLTVTKDELPTAHSSFTNLLISKLDVPVNKTWVWSEADADSVVRWTAKFNLEYREVLVSGEADPNAKVRWSPVYGLDGTTQKYVEISSTTNQGSKTFEDLPMYKVHENGSIYRLIYAVDEVSYTLYGSDDSVIKTWNKSESGHLDQHYSPTYEQDAGEAEQPSALDDWGDWYTINITNGESTKETTNSIDLSIHKIWENDEGHSIAADPASYAEFQLMRYYHEESLDLTQNGLDDPEIPVVTVKLVQGTDTISELAVPKGAPVYIAGVVRPGETVNLAFDNGISLNGGSGESTTQQYIISNNYVTPTADLVINLGSGDTTALVGGVNGLRLASFDSGDITDYQTDDSFNNLSAGQPFILNNENEWQKNWVDLPQVIEERTVSGDHVVLKTIVYSYYLVENGHYPMNYDPVFLDDLGNSSNPMISDTPVVVENKLKTIDLSGTKTWNYIEGDIPADPILKLIRTVSIPTGEGDDETEEVDSVVMSEMHDGVSVNLQPTWSGEGNTRTYTYSGLPEMDQDGNKYNYYVSETKFTVGTGEDAVTYTVVKGDGDTFIVTPNKADAEVFVVKQNDSNITNELLRTTIVINKIDESTRNNASQTPVVGARFRLLKHDGESYAAYEGEYGAITGMPTDDDGTLTFGGLTSGEYMIVETGTPSGYIKTENNDIYFQISNGVVTRYDKAVGDSDRVPIPTTVTVDEADVPNVVADITYMTGAHAATFTVGNTPGAALPHTGGPGTTIISFLGLLLTSLAGAGLMMRKRRRTA